MRITPPFRVAAIATAMVLGAFVADVRAQDESAVMTDVDAALAKLATPPAMDAAMSIARRVRLLDAKTARRFVAWMKRVGGHAAARSLSVLVTHWDAEVRETALAAIAEVRIRMADILAEVRPAIHDESPAVRAAAYVAIGAIGDAADVPALLDAVASGDPDTLRSGYDALRDLSGAPLLYRERVWQRWWKEASESAAERIPKTLLVLEKQDPPAEVGEARSYLGRCGWLDLVHVRGRILAWLESSDPRLRTEAYLLAAALRLGDVADRLGWALGFETDESARAAGIDAAKLLGVRTERASAPARAPR